MLELPHPLAWTVCLISAGPCDNTPLCTLAAWFSVLPRALVDTLVKHSTYLGMWNLGRLDRTRSSSMHAVPRYKLHCAILYICRSMARSQQEPTQNSSCHVLRICVNKPVCITERKSHANLYFQSTQSGWEDWLYYPNLCCFLPLVTWIHFIGDWPTESITVYL